METGDVLNPGLVLFTRPYHGAAAYCFESGCDAKSEPFWEHSHGAAKTKAEAWLAEHNAVVHPKD